MWLAAVLLVFPALSAFAEQDTGLSPIPTNETISKTMNPTSETCASCTPALTYELRKPRKDFYKSTPCSEILNLHPPTNLNNSLSALDKVNGEWWPVCSLSFLNEARENKFNFFLISPHSLSEATKSVAENIAHRDYCALEPSTIRDAEGYVDPTQKEKHEVVMTSDQIKAYLDQVSEARKRVTDQCCTSNPAIEADCRHLMEALNFVLCKPQTDPNKPDPCTENGTYFQAGDEGNILGEVHLSPLTKQGSPLDNLFVVNHELGHACSEALRDIAAKTSSDFEKVNNNVREDHPGKPASGCDLTPEFKRVYADLFSHFGVNDTSATCMLNGADALRNKRFQTGPCLGGCPVAAIEESFANTIAFTSAEHFDAKILDWELCHSVRDNEHLLMMDDLRCVLRSSGFAEKLETGLGCTK